MKKIIFIVLQIFICSSLFAQTPEKINYQAVARNLSGVPLLNQSISVKYEIRTGSSTGSVVYAETHSLTTNPFGLFTAEVGGGTPVVGTMAGVAWGTAPFYLYVEVDGDPMGVTQLLSVPYALFAKESANGPAGLPGKNSLMNITPEPAGANCSAGGNKVESGLDDNNDGSLQALEVDYTYFVCDGVVGATGPQGPIGLTGPTGTTGPAGANGVGIDSTINNNNGTFTIYYSNSTSFTTSDLTGPAGANGTTYFAGSGINLIGDTIVNIGDADNDPSNELISLTNLNGNVIEITENGTLHSIDLSSILGSSYTQGAGISIAGNTISAIDTSATNELQTLSVNGDTLYLSNGNSVILPSFSETITSITDNGDGTYTYTDELGLQEVIDANIDDADADPTNEIQDLSLVGDILTITNNGAATNIDLSIYRELPTTASTGDVLKWNGTTWTPAIDNVNDADNDPTNEIELPASAVLNQVLTWNGSAWIAQNPGSGADNWGSQTVVTNTTLTGNGTAGSPLAVNGILTDNQNLINGGKVGNNQAINIVGGTGVTFSVADSDSSSTNEIQTLSFTSPNLTLSNGGGTVNLSGLAGPPYTAGAGINIASNVISANDTSNTNELQNISAVNSPGTVSLSITGGTGATFSIDDADANPANELITSFGLNGTLDSLVIKEAGNNHAVPLTSLTPTGKWTENAGNLYPTTLSNKVGIGTATPNAQFKMHLLSTIEKGIYIQNAYTGTNSSTGLEIFNNNGFSGIRYGIYSHATGGSSPSQSGYGGYFKSSVINTGSTNYGIYSEAVGGTTNWAGYFGAGNVIINDTLFLPRGATPGYILSSVDVTGKTQWIDPATSINNIYNSNGILTSNRTVTQNANNITYVGGGLNPTAIFRNGSAVGAKIQIDATNAGASPGLILTNNGTNWGSINGTINGLQLDGGTGANVGIGVTPANGKLIVQHAATAAYPTFKLNQTDLNLNRIHFTNTPVANKYWEIAAETDASNVNAGYSINYYNGSTYNIHFLTYGNGKTAINGSGFVPGPNNSMFDVFGTTTLRDSLTIKTSFGNAYTFPVVDGSPNFLMKTDGAGNLSWVDPTSLGSSGWSLTGNAGTNPTTNFIGTTDTNTLAFRTNNIERLRITNSGKIGVGSNSPKSMLQIGSRLHIDTVNVGGITYNLYGYNLTYNGSNFVRTVAGTGIVNYMGQDEFGIEIYGTGAAGTNATSTLGQFTIDTTSAKIRSKEGLDILSTGRDTSLYLRNNSSNSSIILWQNGLGNRTGLKSSNFTANDLLFTLPSDAGTNGFVLKTDGTGVMSWVDPSTFSAANSWTETGSELYNSVPALNVGIGTSTPKSKLNVNGDIGLNDGSTLSSNNAVTILLVNNTGAVSVPGDIVVIGAGDNSFGLTNTPGNYAVLGVVTEAVANGQPAKVAISGVADVNIDGSSNVVRGQHCITGNANGKANGIAIPNAGSSIGVYLTSTAANGTAKVLLR